MEYAKKGVRLHARLCSARVRLLAERVVQSCVRGYHDI